VAKKTSPKQFRSIGAIELRARLREMDEKLNYLVKNLRRVITSYHSSAHNHYVD
jgi:hypothetical protein